MGKLPTGSGPAAFYLRLLTESLQSRLNGQRVLEAGFTGMRVDKLGHKRYYRDGRQVKNPSPEEKQALASHSQQAATASQKSDSAAGGDPGVQHALSQLGTHADPEQVRNVANDLMRLSVDDLAKLASKPAEQATSQGKQSGIGEAGDLVSLDTNQIHVDPKRFQYKQSLDATTGTGDHLKGVNKFNPLFAGVVHAWKDPADGKTYIVNGHHRMELARRAGHQKMNVQMIVAPDAATARATGALINMAEGRGTALDAAKFLRDSNQSIEDLKGHGVSLKEKVVDNAVQLRDLSDRIFNDLLTGRLDEDKAVAIGRHLKDHQTQEQLYNHYLEQRDKNNKDFSAATLEQAAMDVANAPKQQGGGQMDLFGNTDDGKSLFLEKAELKNKLRAALSQEVNDYTVAGNARRAKNIAGAGNVLQVEKNKELSKAADRIKQGFEQFQHLSGPLSDAINAHVEEYANASPKQKRAIVEKALADARGAIQAIISGGAENYLRAGAQDPQGDQSPRTEEPGTVSGDLRGGNAGDLGPSLFGPQDEPTPAAEKSAKTEEPGFTGIDAEGREWRNGELVAKQDEPKASLPGNGLDANALALDALRLKSNRKPHNAAHITLAALMDLKEKGYVNDAGKLTDDGRLYLYAQKGKPARHATGPKVAKTLVGPEAPAPERGSDAELAVLNALRLKANRKAHNSLLITPAALASLKAQDLVDDVGRLTAAGRNYLSTKKSPTTAPAETPAPEIPATSAPEKYFGTGGEHVVVIHNGKKLLIPAPMENVPGWTDYEPVAPKAFYNLDEQEVVEHREAQELVRREWPKFRQEYLTKMGTFDDEGNLISITCNCDDWRDLFPTYKGTNSGSIHDAASYANMRMLNEAWALMKGKGNNEFLVLGGGGGSGKGTATKDIIKVSEYPVVLDSVSDDSAWTKELMDGAAKHGLGGQFVFIDRAPADAWKDGVVKRAMQAREKFDAGDPTSLARTVPLSVAVPANLKARRAALELVEEGKVPSIIINNNLGFGKAKQVEENAVAAYLQQGIGGYNKDELLKELENDTRGLYEQGKIPPDIAKGLLGARAIASGRDQLRPTGAGDSGRPSAGRGTGEDPPGAANQAPLDERGRAPSNSSGQGGQGEGSSEPVAPATDQPQEPSSTKPEVTRAKPRSLVTFGKAITGPSGAKIESYQWQNKTIDDEDKRDGEAAKRVSDWTKAINSVDTGKDIVHHFAVTLPDGSKKIVSLESAIKLLGYQPGDASAAKIRNTAASMRTLATAQMQLALTRQATADNEAIKAKVDKMQPPEMKKQKGMFLGEPNPKHNTYTMGKTSISRPVSQLAGVDSKDPEEDIRQHLTDSWRKNQVIALGGDPYDIHKTQAKSLQEKVRKLEKTLNASATTAYNQPDPPDDSINSASPSQLSQGFTGTDAEGREWRNGELVAQQDETAADKPLVYDSQTNRHNGIQLKRGDILNGPDGQTYHLDRDLGFNLVVDQIKNGRVIGTFSVSTDPSSKQYFPLKYTGKNKYDKPSTDLFGNPLPDSKPKEPETMPGLFGEPVPIGADKLQGAPEPTTVGTDNPLDRPDAAKKDDTQDLFGLFGPGARQPANPDPVSEPTTPAAAASQPESSDEEQLNPKYYEKNADIPQFVKDAGWDTVAKLKNRGITANLIHRVENHADTIIRSVATYLDSPKAELEELKKRLMHQVAVTGGMDSALNNLQWQYDSKSKENHWAPSTGPGLEKISRSIGELRDKLKRPSSQPKDAFSENSPIQTSASANEPKTPDKAPGISLSDVPYDLAYNAHRGTSFVPEKRAKQRQEDYVNQMQADWEYLRKFAKTPEQQEILKTEFARYKAGYLAKFKAKLAADSRILSPMISGPARFPTSRNAKANSAAYKRSQETEEFRKKALFAAAKAINPVTSGAPVLSSDSNAVETLKTQLDQLTQRQDLMKKMNVAYAKFLKNPDSLASSGLSEKLQQSIRDFHASPDDGPSKKIPFPPFKLQNNGANIRRIQDRIETLSKLKAMPEKEEKYTGGISISHDPDDARIRIRFPGKPSPEVIKQIKSRGFIWSPTNGAWQRQLNGNGTYAAQALMAELGHNKIDQKTTEAVMPTDKAAKIALVQAIISQTGAKPPEPKKAQEAACEADPRVQRIRELLAQRG